MSVSGTRVAWGCQVKKVIHGIMSGGPWDIWADCVSVSEGDHRERYTLDSLQVTLMFVTGAVVLGLLLGMTLALLLNSNIHGHGLFREAFTLPLMVPPTIAAMN